MPAAPSLVSLAAPAPGRDLPLPASPAPRLIPLACPYVFSRGTCPPGQGGLQVCGTQGFSLVLGIPSRAFYLGR